MARILIVEDDANFRSALKDALSASGHKVIEADNGKVARDVIMSSPVDLIVSDVQMPHSNGLELLDWVKKNKPTPFILITGFSHIIEMQEAFKLGCDDFLNKPFSFQDLLNSIAKFKSTGAPAVNLDTEYCRISIDDFVSSQRVKIEVHLRLAADKYVCVARQGDRLPADRLELYKRKGLDKFFAHKKDYANLVNFNLGVTRKAPKTRELDFETKTHFVRQAMEMALEECSVKGFDQGAFAVAKRDMETFLGLLCDSDRVFTLLEDLKNRSKWQFAHGMAVALYGMAIGRKLGWNWPATLFKIATAGLLHDIGLKDMNPELIAKDRSQMSPSEISIYETHPERSRDELSKLGELPSDVMQIAFEHHEDNLGTGYPRRIGKLKIHPLAKVISVADRFVYYTVKTPHSAGCMAREAIFILESREETRIDKEAFAALRSLCP